MLSLNLEKWRYHLRAFSLHLFQEFDHSTKTSNSFRNPAINYNKLMFDLPQGKVKFKNKPAPAEWTEDLNCKLVETAVTKSARNATFLVEQNNPFLAFVNRWLTWLPYKQQQLTEIRQRLSDFLRSVLESILLTRRLINHCKFINKGRRHQTQNFYFTVPNKTKCLFEVMKWLFEYTISSWTAKHPWSKWYKNNTVSIFQKTWRLGLNRLGQTSKF